MAITFLSWNIQNISVNKADKGNELLYDFIARVVRNEDADILAILEFSMNDVVAQALVDNILAALNDGIAGVVWEGEFVGTTGNISGDRYAFFWKTWTGHLSKFTVVKEKRSTTSSRRSDVLAGLTSTGYVERSGRGFVVQLKWPGNRPAAYCFFTCADGKTLCVMAYHAEAPSSTHEAATDQLPQMTSLIRRGSFSRDIDPELTKTVDTLPGKHAKRYQVLSEQRFTPDVDRVLLAGDFNVDYDKENDPYATLISNGFEATVAGTSSLCSSPSARNAWKFVCDIRKSSEAFLANRYDNILVKGDVHYVQGKVVDVLRHLFVQDDELALIMARAVGTMKLQELQASLIESNFYYINNTHKTDTCSKMVGYVKQLGVRPTACSYCNSKYLRLARAMGELNNLLDAAGVEVDIFQALLRALIPSMFYEAFISDHLPVVVRFETSRYLLAPMLATAPEMKRTAWSTQVNALCSALFHDDELYTIDHTTVAAPTLKVQKTVPTDDAISEDVKKAIDELF
jgi:hypothetical protein